MHSYLEPGRARTSLAGLRDLTPWIPELPHGPLEIGLTAGGDSYWGYNGVGALGDGTTDCPALVEGFANTP